MFLGLKNLLELMIICNFEKCILEFCVFSGLSSLEFMLVFMDLNLLIGLSFISEPRS